ncbi:MAG: hypothetical protein IT349_00340, partial [Candidatus Eisenbacteria bacterium]|nr:hypothetical protein [Candidatus Eisenbacteria bacterium]
MDDKAGVANRDGGYSDAELDQIEPLLGATGQLIQARRAESERQAAEQARAVYGARLATMIAGFPGAVLI